VCPSEGAAAKRIATTPKAYHRTNRLILLAMEIPPMLPLPVATLHLSCER
jgi:hypothetical protein